MSDAPPTRPESTTAIGAASTIGALIIHSLPPAFLLLCLLNGLLMWMVLDVVKLASQQRLEILQSVIQQCLVKDSK